jgi:hypothetical protein
MFPTVNITLLLRFYYEHEELSTMLLRCLYDYGASTTFFYDFTPILVGHDPATLVLSMLKKNVARA